MKRILFQGDSITDAERNRSDFYSVGRGYASFVKGAMALDEPGEFEFINRGVAGNRIVDIFARIKLDFINLAPDYASIYVGVNDAHHELYNQNGISTAKFEKIFEMMLSEVYEALPDIKLMIIAPFILKGELTLGPDNSLEYYNIFRKDVEQKAQVCKKIAAKYGLPLIELQPIFDEKAKICPDSYWTVDGVHPTQPGHEIIKRLWIENFNKIG